MVLNALNPMVRVQVLVQRNLEDRCATLSAGDSGRGQEVVPGPEPLLTVLGQNLLLVSEPVLVPAVEGGRVVDTEDVDVFDFETGGLELGDDPAERARGVGTGEDVFVHEKTPG